MTRPRQIRRGLLGGVALLLLCAILTGVVLAGALGYALDRIGSTVTEADALSNDAAQLRAALLDQETGLRGYELTGDDAFLQPYRVGLRNESGAIDALLAGAPQSSLRAAVREVDRLAVEWRSAWVAPMLDLVESGDLDAVRERVATGDGRLLFDRVRGALGRVDIAITDLRSDALASVAATGRFADLVILLTVGAYGGVLLIGAWWVLGRVAAPLDELAGTAEALERGEEVHFAARRPDEIGMLAATLDRMQATIRQRYEAATRLAARSTTFNRLSELMSYAEDEDAVVRAGIAALEHLVPNRGGNVLLVNPSFDQLRVHSSWGDVGTAMEGPMRIDRPTACPGIRRNTIHVTRSALDAFSLTCAIHPLRTGSLLCVPMASHNEVIGVIHIERADEDAFSDEDTRTASRVAEQLALATANLRLVHRMEQQAMTDPLTGLANPRSFDPIVDRELAIARREGQPVAIVMLDLDHFKGFNDTHGHPAGDEALRAFARTVRAALRETDVAARYGGEEFAILLRRTDLKGACVLAEKVRSAIESTPIEIGPNRFARITASLGVAASDEHGTDRMQLMRMADAALYAAKNEGRNRVSASAAATVGEEPSEGQESEGARPTPIHRQPSDDGPVHRRVRRTAGFDPRGEPTV